MVKVSSLSVSVKGPGHKLNGLPNQDSILVKKVPTGWLAVVCDGMGSKSHADVGSRLATQAVYQLVCESSFDIDSRTLIKRIYQHWIDSLGKVNPRQAVTTCLFSWLTHDGNLRTFQLGDGAIFSSDQGGFVQSNTLDSRFGNETTGLGISTNFSDWKVGESQLQCGEFVAVMTDGISEDLISGMESEFVGSIIENTFSKSARRAKTWLKKELQHWGTPNHLDDKTLALLVIKNER